MVTQGSNPSCDRTADHQPNASVDDASLADQRPTHLRIRLRIPKDYHQEPIISRLISQHGVIVNIAAALLGVNARDDGWFDLDLQGSSQQIRSALIYLDELDLEVWREDVEPQEDGW